MVAQRAAPGQAPRPAGTVGDMTVGGIPDLFHSIQMVTDSTRRAVGFERTDLE